MHPTQKKILEISKTLDISKLSLRKLGKLIGVKNPQVVKYHLIQLKKAEFKKVNIEQNLKNVFSLNPTIDDITFNIPILGYANCGLAKEIAEEKELGYLTVSNSLVRQRKNLFALIAVGNSMNNVDLHSKSIENGDYIIIDGENRSPKDGDLVVSIIDGCANIKKFFLDKKNSQIVLRSESLEISPDIIIHPDDFSSYMVNGIVVDVVKKPNVSV